MNDEFRDLKERTRRLDALLLGGGIADTEFAQAVSRLQRALRRGDRTRPPTPELRRMLEQAELLGGRNP